VEEAAAVGSKGDKTPNLHKCSRSGAEEQAKALHKILQSSAPEEDEAALVRVLCLEEH
jgi:hypothetical protein